MRRKARAIIAQSRAFEKEIGMREQPLPLPLGKDFKGPFLTTQGVAELVEFGTVYGPPEEITIYNRKAVRFKVWMGAWENGRQPLQVDSWFVFGDGQRKAVLLALKPGMTIVVSGPRRGFISRKGSFTILSYVFINQARTIDIISTNTDRHGIQKTTQEIKLYDRTLA